VEEVPGLLELYKGTAKRTEKDAWWQKCKVVCVIQGATHTCNCFPSSVLDLVCSCHFYIVQSILRMLSSISYHFAY
jgi:hypothetical protein